MTTTTNINSLTLQELGEKRKEALATLAECNQVVFDKIAEELMKNYLTVQNLANFSGFSESYLRDKFHLNTGTFDNRKWSADKGEYAKVYIHYFKKEVTLCRKLCSKTHYRLITPCDEVGDPIGPVKISEFTTKRYCYKIILD